MKMGERPKRDLEKNDWRIPGQDGFWYQLMHDDDLKDKLEDNKPFNTFVELLLWAILVLTILGFVMDFALNFAELTRIFGPR